MFLSKASCDQVLILQARRALSLDFLTQLGDLLRRHGELSPHNLLLFQRKVVYLRKLILIRQEM